MIWSQKCDVLSKTILTSCKWEYWKQVVLLGQPFFYANQIWQLLIKVFRHTEDLSIIVLVKIILILFFLLDAFWNFNSFLISAFFRAFVTFKTPFNHYNKFRYQFPVTSYCPLKIFFGLLFPDKGSERIKSNEFEYRRHCSCAHRFL